MPLLKNSQSSVCGTFKELSDLVGVQLYPYAPYYVRFYRNYSGPEDTDYSLIGVAETLKQAQSLRVCAGDLVVDNEGRIVQDTAWLWTWEKTQFSYTHTLIERFGRASV
jgi:hypothetical protein